MAAMNSLRRLSVRVLAVVAAGAMLAACGDSEDPLDDSSGGTDAPSDTIVVGSANFPESTLIAEIYAAALDGAGVKVDKNLSIGAREASTPALQDGSIDLMPEYTGNLATYFNNGDDISVTDPKEVYDKLKSLLPDDLTVLDMSDAEDKDTLAVTKETADKDNLKSISDLKEIAKDLTVGGAPEFQTRYAGLVGLKEVYGLEFGSFTPLDAGGPLTISALADGSIDVGNIFSTSSAIEENDFVVLEDPENVFQAQNVVPLLNKEKASDTVAKTLNAVSAALTTDNLKKMVKQVEVDKAEPAEVAADFVKSNNLG